jgi:hypothetical protein
MDFQLGGLVLLAPSLGCGCVLVPVAAAAAAPAAAEPLPAPWWRLPPPLPSWRVRTGGSTLPVVVIVVGTAAVPRGGGCVLRAAITPIVATVDGSRSAAPQPSK